MKMKSWVLWLLVVAFLASEVFLFSANRQKDAALEQAHAARQEADQARADLEQLRTANVLAQDAEVSKLRADNQDLPRLRNQVTQLQAANQKLSQQLSVTLTAAQQQQDQLQQIQAENQQAREAAQQAYAEAELEKRNECINNLRQIDAAKQQWALENNKTADTIPTAQDLLPYLKDQTFPVCPSGGTYTINAVGIPPTCSTPGHVLPQ
jgi:small-conductance mechanosensitive channel